MTLACRIILTLQFAWLVITGASVLAVKNSMDEFLLREGGRLWIFYTVIPVVICCSAWSIAWVWRGFARGALIALAGVWLNVFETLAASRIAVDNPALAKAAILASPEGRLLSQLQVEFLAESLQSETTAFVFLSLPRVTATIWTLMILWVWKARLEDDNSKPLPQNSTLSFLRRAPDVTMESADTDTVAPADTDTVAPADSIRARLAIVTCPNCGTTVVRKPDGSCPACQTVF